MPTCTNHLAAFALPQCGRRACLGALLAASAVPVLGQTPSVLRVLAWPGYADADVVQAFEQRTGARVELTIIDTDELLWARMAAQQGLGYDVLAVNTAELQRYIDRGWVAPVPTQSMRGLQALQARFRRLDGVPGLERQGQIFALPYTYSDMGLIYDRAQMSSPPHSIEALWDARWRGKVLMYDGGSHAFSIAAMRLRKPSPFRLADADWPASVQALIELRRNALGFYTQPEESVALFQRHGAALMFGNYGNQQVELLRKAGVSVGYAIPQEGALAWLDCWALTRAGAAKALALAWLEYMLEPGPAQALVQRQGLSSAVLSQGKDDSRLWWLEPVENLERRNRYWQRIVAGDRATRVLVP